MMKLFDYLTALIHHKLIDYLDLSSDCCTNLDVDLAEVKGQTCMFHCDSWVKSYNIIKNFNLHDYLMAPS